jgi:hypothetical protein
MRLFGRLDGKIDYRDRPQWMGDIFDRGWAPAYPDRYQWQAIATVGFPGVWLNAAAASGTWLNVASASGSWLNI